LIQATVPTGALADVTAVLEDRGTDYFAADESGTIESTLEEDVRTILDSEEYGNVTLVNVEVVQKQAALNPHVDKVIITIGHPPGERHPELYDEIDRRVQDRMERSVPVDIQVTLVVNR